MYAIFSNLKLCQVPDPIPHPHEVLVDIHAIGVNRADILQAAGHYPPPPGITDILGLECAGYRHDTGEPVACLLAGGAYAQKIAVPRNQLLPIPKGWTLEETASIVEVACTVHSNLSMLAGLKKGDRILIHGGAGGIGSFAIQYAKALGAHVTVTAGSAENLDYCAQLGADTLINYKEEDFSETHANSFDIILDIMGAKYLSKNIKALADSGHLVIIGLQGGIKAEFNIAALLNKRGTISATALRSRSEESKTEIIQSTIATVWPLLESGQIRPFIHASFPLNQAQEAHDLLLSGTNRGKIILTTKDLD